MGSRSRRKANFVASTLSLVLVVASVLTIPAFAGAAEPSIAIDKTVYIGHDGGGGCSGSEAVEAPVGTDVTFCFRVTNTGTEPLGGAAVGDPALGITSADMTLKSGDPDTIAAGASVVWFYETAIVGDLVNTATVGAFPLNPSGGPSYGDDPAIASDTASVTVGGPSEPLEPAISIDKTVYAGHDAGGSCPGAESVTVNAGDDLTFCFQVTNTGDTHLANVTIGDPILGISQDQMTVASGSLSLMAPGDVTFLYYETTAGELAFVNTATTPGTPATPEGTEIPSVQPPTDDDDASVDIEDETVVPTAAIDIEKRLYAGHDGGASCPGQNAIEVTTGTAITYCFEVTNTGEAHLANVSIDDPTLGITDADMTLLSGDPALLAPGATAVWFYETTATSDVVNVASTTGTPAEPDGTPIPDVESPEAEDDASVDVEDQTALPTADIEIVKLVYEGHDNGALCDSTADGADVFSTLGTPITYCFVVTNTGEAHLADVTVDDPTLGITDADMTLLSGDPTLLAPGATVVWYYETTIEANVTNVASTTGTPARPDGTPIPEVEPPTDDDNAVVGDQTVLDEEIEIEIEIDKRVYEGHDGGAGCATAADDVFAEYGTAITFCFEVTNTGTVHLADVSVDDPTLGITNADMTLLSDDPTLLAPGETVVWYYETTLDNDVTNIASTTGTPVEPDGTPIPATPPSDSDDATVGEQEVLQESLPATGIDADIIAWMGVLMLSAGAAMLAAANRRRPAIASIRASLRASPRVWTGNYSMAPNRDRATARNRRPLR